MMGEKKRNVTFNLDDPQEKALFDYSKTINFSKFVKLQLAIEMRMRSYTLERHSNTHHHTTPNQNK